MLISKKNKFISNNIDKNNRTSIRNSLNKYHNKIKIF